MAFTATNKMPGVYIDEIEVPGPIAGVATSVLALIGPAEFGPINQPKLVTNPTQFENTFGGHLTAPVFYASHALRGYFENGGSSCYFVRVGTAARASRDLDDQAASPTLVVTALKEGVRGNDIRVEVQPASIASTSAQAGATTVGAGGAANNSAEVADGTQFRPGDVILFDDGGGTTETATVQSIAGNQLTLTGNLSNPFAAGNAVRVADLAVGREELRVADSAGIEAGSYVRISQGGTDEGLVVNAVDGTNHVLTFASPLANAYTMAAGDPPVQVQSQEFNLLATDPMATPAVSETFSKLAMDSRHSRYFGSVIAAQASTLIGVALADDPPNPTPPPANLPAPLAAAPLTGGANDSPAALGPVHYQAAIDALERVDEVTMLAIPDRTDVTVQGAMITHCEKMKDRFAILDPQRGAAPANGIRSQRDALNSDRGYAALYYPWISVSNPDPAVQLNPGLSPEQRRMLIPPSGHVAGVFARTDDTKGVHKAPANEQIKGVLELERTLNDTEAGQLNELSINVLRKVPNRGFRVWGARTLTKSTQWRYVNVRRLLLFIEESIQEGTEFAVFEPNNPSLWKTVKRQVDEFLTTVWATGAFVGATPERSFLVRVDEELNPPGQMALGILTFEVRVYPAPPAEFIVFRVIQEPGGPRLEEA